MSKKKLHPNRSSCRRRLAVGMPTAMISASLLLSGCGGPSANDLTASAKRHLESNDAKAAAIELRSALQKSPNGAETRFLFGKTLMTLGNPAAAALEFEKAGSLGYPNNEVAPLLAGALVAAGQSKKVTDSYATVTLSDPKAEAELKAMVATAYAIQKDAVRSQAAVATALQADPGNIGAVLLDLRLRAGRGEIDAALATVDGLLAANPELAAVWVVKGELLWTGKSDPKGATQAFRRALAIDPKQARARVALITLAAQANDLPTYRSEVNELAKARPEDFESRYFLAQLALMEGDLKTARERTQQLLRLAPDHPLALQLAGAVELRLGALGSAQRLLQKALLQEPDSVSVRQLLGQAYVQSGQSTRAVATLQPFLTGSSKPSADVLALAADAYRQDGELDKAEQLYAQAAKADPTDLKPRVALATLQMGRGDFESGLGRLQAMASEDSSTYADMALISALMKRTDTAAALKAIDRLETKTPTKALPHQLRGQILLERGDTAGARASFEKAMKVEPGFYPVISDLANLDLAQNRPADALKRYEDALAREPDNLRAQLAVTDLKQRAGANADDIEKRLAAIVRQHPEEVSARLAYIQQLLGRHQFKAAVAAAEEGLVALPDSAELMDALGRAQLSAGSSTLAMQAFQKAATTHPTQPMPWLRLADVYASSRNYPAAIQSLRKAHEVSPRFLLAQRKLVQVLMTNKQPGEAMQVAKQVQSQRPGEAVGYLIEGEIQLAQRHWAPAVDAYQAALKREPSPEVARRLHSLYALAGRQADADRFAAEWRRDHADDMAFLIHLGSIEMDRGNYPVAERHFREVLARRPDDAAILNNVAWLLMRQNKPGAVPLLEHALKVMPDMPEVMDTMAAILDKDKQPQKALEWQRKAVDRAPNTPIFRLRLAKLLVANGDRSQARVELERLASLGAGFDEQAEVSAMLKSL